ncbi:MAG: ubiquinone-dependent pyruvate dehydrogenase [Candidatus Acidiferrum sp.]|jgi:pyruvate dehydrogenase (quinone)
MASVAEKLVEMLAQAGVKRIYGVVGDSLNSIVDAVRRNKSIEWVNVRHEEVGAFAAGAEAQLTGNLTVCAGSCGPGNLHLINGLYDCHRSYAPVLAIAAHIPSSEIGTSYFQETHPERIFVDCSYYCETISSPSQMPRTAQAAIHAATNKRGVAVLVIPGDVALASVSGEYPPHDLRAVRSLIRPVDSDLEELARLLNSSQKCTLFCGAGCSGAQEEVLALAETLQSPVAHSLRGKEHVEWDNPYDVGMTGLIGFPPGYRAMMNCDALLMLGTDFPYDNFYPTKTKIAQIDIRGGNIGRRARLDLGLLGDVRETVRALLPKLEKKKKSSHLRNAVEDYAELRGKLDKHVETLSKDDGIHPQHLATVLSELADENAIFTTDTGMCNVWSARYLRMKKGRKLIGSFNHGSMANAMPQAIGAQMAFPDRQVVTFSGDGGLGMLLGDLLSLVQHDLPVKIVVFNNSTLGMVKLEMQTGGFPDFGVDFKRFNFAKIAEGVGLRSFRVERPGDLRDAVRSAFRHKGPALLDVVTNPYELSKPPKIDKEQAWGFGLFTLKELMLGNVKEVYEELKSLV